jgi:ABC-type enterobactin transport system permease subunit
MLFSHATTLLEFALCLVVAHRSIVTMLLLFALCLVAAHKSIMEARHQCLLVLMQTQLANDEEDELFTQILLAPMENTLIHQHGGFM